MFHFHCPISQNDQMYIQDLMGLISNSTSVSISSSTETFQIYTSVFANTQKNFGIFGEIGRQYMWFVVKGETHEKH